MRRTLAPFILVPALVGALGCSKPKVKPDKPVPPGTLIFQFNKKVKGPIDLTIDGVRIPVQPTKKDQPAMSLVVTGLPAGSHRFFITSPRDAFSPDQGEVALTAERGAYVFTFAQGFNAVLYGKPEPLPPTQGLPGVKAHAEP